MRQISPDLQARLDAQATTFCHCWKAIRRDREIACFTDHDQSLAFGGLTYLPIAGLDSSSTEAQLGFAVGTTEVSGALTLPGLDAFALASGLWDGAGVETWLVDWRAPQHRLLLDVSTIGEVRRSEHAFIAELRSLAHRLDQETGRRFQRSCSADLGDAWCKVSLDSDKYRIRLSVIQQFSHTHVTLEAAGLADGWFAGGTLAIVAGESKGALTRIKSHWNDQAGSTVETWTPLGSHLASGNVVELTAGCDKSFGTCRQKFRNSANFRGFPHIPGVDVLAVVPGGNVALDGGSLFR